MPKHYVTRLAAALRAGQGAERLYDEYGIALFGYCWAMLGERTEAAGALTDTVLVATAHADALADPGDLTPWVFALARNECLRRRPDAPPPASPYQCDPYADVLTMLVARALTDLRPADRELIDLAVRYRLTVYQLSRVLDLDQERAREFARIAVTRFDQTLSTLFMVSSGRLAVPREIIADRPPLRVLLDMLPPERPPGELRANIAAACGDPGLEHYRQMVARRVLPLGDQGFPHRLDPERADRRPAAHGTAAMPLAAPVITAQDVPPEERTTGGSPALEPIDANLISPDAVSRARTDAPAPEPAEAPGAPVIEPAAPAEPQAGAAGHRTEHVEHAAEHAAPPKRMRQGRSRPRGSRGQRFRRAVGVVLAVLAIALAIWAAGQIFAPTGSSGPKVAPSATTGDDEAAPVPTAPHPSPSKNAGPSSWPTGAGGGAATPTRTGPSSPGRGRTWSAPPGGVRHGGHPGDPAPSHHPPRSSSPGKPPTTHKPTPTKTTPTATETPPTPTP